MAEQVGFGGFRDVLQVIDVALAQSFQHEGTVVLKRDEVHYLFRRREAGLGGRQMESGLQAIDVGHDPLVQFDECGAGLAEVSIVFGQLAEVREFAGWQGAQAGLTVLGPGNDGGGVERSLVGSAVTGGLAAASMEVVDGTFDELTQGEQGIELTLVVVEQRLEGLTQTAGAIGRGGQGRFSSLCYIS